MTQADSEVARSELTEQRDFLLRSLRDLDAERAAGDIDEDDYVALRDEYTARTAAVLRRLDRASGGHVDGPASVEGGVRGGSVRGGSVRGGSVDGVRVEPRHRRRRRLLVAAAVAAAAVGVTAGALVRNSGGRDAGQEITGDPVGQEQVAQLLFDGQKQVDAGDSVAALKDYNSILDKYPNQPLALTQEGWLLAQTRNPALLQQGITMLTRAEQATPPIAAARVYRGIALIVAGDNADAIPDLEWYLAHDPTPALAPRVTAALAQAKAAVAATKAKARAVTPAPPPAG